MLPVSRWSEAQLRSCWSWSRVSPLAVLSLIIETDSAPSHVRTRVCTESVGGGTVRQTWARISSSSRDMRRSRPSSSAERRRCRSTSCCRPSFSLRSRCSSLRNRRASTTVPPTCWWSSPAAAALCGTGGTPASPSKECSSSSTTWRTRASCPCANSAASACNFASSRSSSPESFRRSISRSKSLPCRRSAPGSQEPARSFRPYRPTTSRVTTSSCANRSLSQRAAKSR
mmetsp:Transcript_6983/g.14529  ORF Transcript_6983/g.14529 Transcript_6983/m.14529 type:complete len:229 (-) Transcript_6983:190-876(-)